jgi:hypothetical protein
VRLCAAERQGSRGLRTMPVESRPFVRPGRAAQGRVEANFLDALYGRGPGCVARTEGATNPPILNDQGTRPRVYSACGCRTMARRADDPSLTARWSRSACVAPSVVWISDSGWSIYGAKRSQPVATGGNCTATENGSNKPKSLPRVATSCRRTLMVRVHPSKKGRGRLSGCARSANSCEPEGPQDLTQDSDTTTAGA